MRAKAVGEGLPAPCNGLDVPTLFQTVRAIGAQAEQARLRFRASNCWRRGTASVGRFETVWGSEAAGAHAGELLYDFDHPKVLIGRDPGLAPIEFLLLCLAGCLTAGITNIAAARGVTLTEVTSTVEGDLDLERMLGRPAVRRPGTEEIRVNFTLRGDAPARTLSEIVEQSRTRATVLDALTLGTDIEIRVKIE